MLLYFWIQYNIPSRPYTDISKLETIIVASLTPSHWTSFIATYVYGLRLGYRGHSQPDFLSSCYHQRKLEINFTKCKATSSFKLKLSCSSIFFLSPENLMQSWTFRFSRILHLMVWFILLQPAKQLSYLAILLKLLLKSTGRCVFLNHVLITRNSGATRWSDQRAKWDHFS